MLKIEAVAKMDNYLTICQHKREKPKNIKISETFDCFGVKQACFP